MSEEKLPYGKLKEALDGVVSDNVCSETDELKRQVGTILARRDGWKVVKAAICERAAHVLARECDVVTATVILDKNEKH